MSKEQVYNTAITKDDILKILKGYRDLKKHVLQLEYELAEANPLVNDEEVIVSMALNESSFNDKTKKRAGTDNIALSYAKTVDEINMRHKQSLEDELTILKRKKERLEYYISLLDRRQADVLTLIYFDGLTFNQAADKLFISSSALKSARTSGIKKLVEMYGNIIGVENLE